MNRKYDAGNVGYHSENKTNDKQNSENFVFPVLKALILFFKEFHLLQVKL